MTHHFCLNYIANDNSAQFTGSSSSSHVQFQGDCHNDDGARRSVPNSSHGPRSSKGKYNSHSGQKTRVAGVEDGALHHEQEEEVNAMDMSGRTCA